MKWWNVSLIIGALSLTSACSQLRQEIPIEQTIEVDKGTLTTSARTQVAIPTSTSIQTKTPPPTLTVPPPHFGQLSNITIELGDIPEVFIEVDPAGMYLSEEGIRSQFSAGCEITVGDIFTFIYQEEYNLIYGWTLYSLQSTCFDTAVEELAESFMSEATREGEISEERLLIDAKEIGEVSISPRVVVDTEDVSFVKVLDSIYFRRGEFISYIYMQYAYGETPVISIIELGKIIDNKIIDVLDQ